MNAAANGKNGRAVDLFAGPGGWDVAAGGLDILTIGIEHDRAACATRAAAGHLTLRADVSQYDPRRFIGFDGLIASPPCPTFSAAGKGSGTAELSHLLACIRAGEWSDPWGFYQWDDPRTPLVMEPLRWAEAIRPRWIALEQVPAVLPVWEVTAEVLRSWGYATWTGVLNAADYGVPQTRKRAILTASLDRLVERPAPTHARNPQPSLWTDTPEPWISMAEALGWGMTERPMPTVTGGGCAAGGPEPIARGGRALLEKERGGASWLPYGECEVRA